MVEHVKSDSSVLRVVVFFGCVVSTLAVLAWLSISRVQCSAASA